MGEQDKDESKQEIGTVRSNIVRETTGENAPDADKGGTTGNSTGDNEESEDFDSTSGAGGTTAGGGTSGVPT